MTKHHINLVNLTNDQLRTFHKNATRMGEHELATKIIRELYRRGALRRKETVSLRWNEATVAELLRPFAEVAGSVTHSRRTPFTTGGGLRRRRNSDPEKMLVDSYSAIKRGAVNAAFAGRIKLPGDEPVFELLSNGKKKEFQPGELNIALEEWKQIAAAA